MQKQLATLNNIRVLLKSVLIDVISCTRKPLCVHARHRERSLPNLVKVTQEVLSPEVFKMNRSVMNKNKEIK